MRLLSGVELVVSWDRGSHFNWKRGRTVQRGACLPDTGRKYLCGHHRWCRSRDHRQDHDDGQHPSSHDPYRLGFESGRGHAYHSHAHDDRPCGESSRPGHDEVEESRSDDEENGRDGWALHGERRGRGRSRSARMLKEEYEPTNEMSAPF